MRVRQHFFSMQSSLGFMRHRRTVFISKALKIFILFICFLSIIYLGGCAGSRGFYCDNNRVALKAFFSELMIEEGGIFTLMGSKPLTEVYWDQKKGKMDQWELVEREVHLSGNFLLIQGKESHWLEGGKKIELDRVSFVNVKQTVCVLEDYYDAFSSLVGFEFDPLEVVLEMKQGSRFWDRLKESRNHYLWGLLYGFGEKNAHAFHQKYSGKGDKMVEYCSYQEEVDVPSIKELLIPWFVSFSREDPVIQKYRDERSKIQEVYRGHDFLTKTLELLEDKS